MKTQYAVVTGTSSGLGLSMAESLLEKGYIVFGGSRTESPIEHENFIDIELDLRNESSVLDFMGQISQETRYIDLFVNNAGICRFSSGATLKTEDALDHFKTNALGGQMVLTRLRPLLILNESHIVNILSLSAKYPHMNTTAYSMAEKAKLAAIEIFRKEWKNSYKVSNLFVGAVDTEMWDSLGGDLNWDKMLDIDEFMYVFDTVVDAPLNVQFPDITFLHKDSFVQ